MVLQGRPSELGLVTSLVLGRSCTTGCDTAPYCARSCQAARWSQHTQKCGPLSVAAAAAASDAAVAFL
ncbi:hypothetical protein COO60DRAFT_1641540 [Scenedesmus sp. NREL 46B-D3]|nr:hypothetical protein COO60DRAFT_1641540 [Scenedesmus sp. NREL 46B-D3]